MQQPSSNRLIAVLNVPISSRERRSLQKTAAKFLCVLNGGLACKQTRTFAVSSNGLSPRSLGSSIVQKPPGARDGNRTHDPSLTKTVRYRCATRANPIDRWAVRDSNPRSLRQLIYSQPHLATLVTAQR